ncbi:hypothetical protein CRE_09514 [Caenorhabditis remanei]|uniref:Uncharacterized protein n=2 Tax=Caenorhabditis remanei TaxID=31234 RepID=E3MJ61_CAERE|nr:hypothetical protein CRE_09514 [Caenorhabditis remanei]
MSSNIQTERVNAEKLLELARKRHSAKDKKKETKIWIRLSNFNLINVLDAYVQEQNKFKNPRKRRRPTEKEGLRIRKFRMEVGEPTVKKTYFPKKNDDDKENEDKENQNPQDLDGIEDRLEKMWI